MQKQQTGISAFRSGPAAARAVFLCLAFIFFLTIGGGDVFVASPAQAADCWLCTDDGEGEAEVIAANEAKKNEMSIMEWLKNAAQYVSIINLWAAVNQLWDDLTALFSDEKKQAAVLKAMQEQLFFDKKADMFDEKVKADYMMQSIRREAQLAAETVQPPAEQSPLCYMITARQAMLGLNEFSKIISKWALSGLIADRRGNGPVYSAVNRAITCGKLDPNDPKTGYETDDPNCAGPKDVTLAGDVKVDFEAIGASIRSVSSGQIVLKAPQLDTQTVTTASGQSVPITRLSARNGDPQQQMWIAGYDYCSRMAGPRPNPPPMSVINGPEGQRKMTIYSNCVSQQTVFMKACTDRLGRMTRPDCSVDTFKPFCTASYNLCLAAKASGITLDPRFEDCKNGLSYDEAQEISTMFCAAQGRQQGSVLTGAKPESLLAFSDYCAQASLSLQRYRIYEAKSMVKVQRALDRLKYCWGRL